MVVPISTWLGFPDSFSGIINCLLSRNILLGGWFVKILIMAAWFFSAKCLVLLSTVTVSSLQSQLSPVSKGTYREYLGKLDLLYAKLLVSTAENTSPGVTTRECLSESDSPGVTLRE